MMGKLVDYHIFAESLLELTRLKVNTYLVKPKRQTTWRERKNEDECPTETRSKKLSTRCTFRTHISSVCLERISYWFNSLFFLTEDLKASFSKVT